MYIRSIDRTHIAATFTYARKLRPDLDPASASGTPILKEDIHTRARGAPNLSYHDHSKRTAAGAIATARVAAPPLESPIRTAHESTPPPASLPPPARSRAPGTPRASRGCRNAPSRGLSSGLPRRERSPSSYVQLDKNNPEPFPALPTSLRGLTTLHCDILRHISATRVRTHTRARRPRTYPRPYLVTARATYAVVRGHSESRAYRAPIPSPLCGLGPDDGRHMAPPLALRTPASIVSSIARASRPTAHRGLLHASRNQRGPCSHSPARARAPRTKSPFPRATLSSAERDWRKLPPDFRRR